MREQTDRLPEIQARAAKALAGSVDVDWLIGEVVRLRADGNELQTANKIQEAQLATVDQQWGAIAEAVHDWEMGALTADAAIRRVRDIQAPAARITRAGAAS